jgi:hypothetical protein
MNTDIDGKPIVILSEAEARRVYDDYIVFDNHDSLDRELINKIATTLNLPTLE